MRSDRYFGLVSNRKCRVERSDKYFGLVAIRETKMKTQTGILGWCHQNISKSEDNRQMLGVDTWGCQKNSRMKKLVSEKQ